MSLDPQILELLVCPEARTPLAPASSELIADVNARIAAGDQKNHAGEPVTDALSDALVREDGKCLYRVDDSIPNLLIDARIDL